MPWEADAQSDIVVSHRPMTEAEKLAYDKANHSFFWRIGHFLGIVGDDHKPSTAQQHELGSRFVATYNFAVRQRARDMADPGFAAMSMSTEVRAHSIAMAQVAAQRQVTYGVALAATGPAAAALGATIAPVSLPGFLAASGTEGAYIGSLTRGAAGGEISLGSIAFDGGVGALGGLAGRYVIGPVAGWAAGKIAARFAPAAESAAVRGAATVEARGGAYVLRDAEGTVVRSGRTNDLARREAEHLRDPDLAEFQFEPAYRTDVYAEQRGLEQILHDRYSPALNKIRPISPSNAKLPTYMDAAQKYLLEHGGP